MARIKPISLPHTVPELQALVRKLEGDIAARRKQKAEAMARYRANLRKARRAPPAQSTNVTEGSQV